MRQITWDPRRPRAPVVLDSPSPGMVAEPNLDLMSIWLREADADGVTEGSAEHQQGGIEVFLGEERVGLLGPEASREYRPLVRECQEAGVIPVLLAQRRRAEDGSLSLRIGLPMT